MRHQALWSFQDSGIYCGGDLPKIQIQCLNDGTLTLLEELYPDETDCEMDPDDNGKMICEETCKSCGHFEWTSYSQQFSGVSYECSGPSYDSARSEVTYLSSEVYCESWFTTDSLKTLGHRVRLGLYCGTVILGGEFSFADRYHECGPGNKFNVENGEGGYFECLETDELPFVKDTRIDRTIPDVVIYAAPASSAALYRKLRDSNCFVAELSETAATLPDPDPTPTSPAAPGGDDGNTDFSLTDCCSETCGCVPAP